MPPGAATASAMTFSSQLNGVLMRHLVRDVKRHTANSFGLARLR